MENPVFKKYCYWMDKEALEALKSMFKKEGTEIYCAQRVPCELFRVEIGYSAPEVWKVTCKHDAAPWYNTSDKNGKFLVLSSKPLSPEFEKYLETTITKSDFQPQGYPSKEEIKALANSEIFNRKKPEGWVEFPKETAEKLAQGFKNVVGVDEPLEEIFEVWSAVHSNFLEGRFSVKEGTNTIPYTIADTNHTSSCCIELFNIVGKEFKAKYVKPCLGAKIAKALEADIYYRVENLKGIK
ncbi:MAG: hypothetical protein A3C43_01475 [Candidatus Schekmanbacteria bacterium RIFCSPHIGHO2_02_FULL_38_11]|uniref:Uncharacterized protein n=1 Tax=Candidatus Schekmanbacteria bacterium RIFCSPLOWO2_12_FULL_38_15 TaxID=1817883 RepID=A0A1F7SFB2_9BACT|nr:MAG: hypothetical protein A2043_01705 [Candidatus Schekmanbacteria bacterium GWA2_38_9]OGL48341.1 MAG: hypothetical protein A3H37_05050 [Candidatus Schekmanbacteria bacterium RIFCSPLOWO2_02_FULL_38_14]OGL51867.1 MAG: hypothetical protein A3G31_05655 [Candidatus Schekmanbacteria bacterium RIFCSPLOWO2_12_FULL_38_15]OGL51955.1 MAG: hypothetical protein A3C43_01475 [Candidatus Schekmanbacteria bacterium RIFCSPHIGHO2_02_FULL_38_11]